jgi:hypothetical protein
MSPAISSLREAVLAGLASRGDATPLGQRLSRKTGSSVTDYLLGTFCCKFQLWHSDIGSCRVQWGSRLLTTATLISILYTPVEPRLSQAFHTGVSLEEEPE